MELFNNNNNNNVRKVKDPPVAAEEDPNTTGYLRGKARMRTLCPYTAKSPCILSTSSPWQAAGKLKDAVQIWQSRGIFSSPIKAVCRVYQEEIAACGAEYLYKCFLLAWTDTRFGSQIRELTFYRRGKKGSMDSNKDDDGLLNRIAFPGAMSLANSHVHPHGVPLREPFAVPFHLDPSYWEQAYRGHTGRISYIPFPGYMGIYDYSFEPAFIRKRNERERQRVRCVNEGYTRLREHLPKEFADKRLSKVETLRAAISYIKHLQSLLDCHPLGSNSKETLSAKELPEAPSPGPLRECNSDGESKTSSASSPYSEFEETGS